MGSSVFFRKGTRNLNDRGEKPRMMMKNKALINVKDIDEGICKSKVFLLTENLETKISNLF
jgi:hypothetical protein